MQANSAPGRTEANATPETVAPIGGASQLASAGATSAAAWPTGGDACAPTHTTTATAIARGRTRGAMSAGEDALRQAPNSSPARPGLPRGALSFGRPPSACSRSPEPRRCRGEPRVSATGVVHARTGSPGRATRVALPGYSATTKRPKASQAGPRPKRWPTSPARPVQRVQTQATSSLDFTSPPQLEGKICTSCTGANRLQRQACDSEPTSAGFRAHTSSRHRPRHLAPYAASSTWPR